MTAIRITRTGSSRTGVFYLYRIKISQRERLLRAVKPGVETHKPYSWQPAPAVAVLEPRRTLPIDQRYVGGSIIEGEDQDQDHRGEPSDKQPSVCLAHSQSSIVVAVLCCFVVREGNSR